MATEPYVLTVPETAAVVRMSVKSTYEAIKRGELPAIRVGRRVLVPRAKLLALLGEDATTENVQTKC